MARWLTSLVTVVVSVAKSCTILCIPMNCSLPGSSVHGIFQARVLEWVAIAFSQWTWVWVNSGSWWWTGKPGMMQSMGSQSRTWLIDWTELKGNQPWVIIGRTDAEAEAPILWPLDMKNRLAAKDPDAGKDWRQEEKGMTEDEILGWHHRLNGQEFEQTPGDSVGQGSLPCCSPWGRKKSDKTKPLNKAER